MSKLLTGVVCFHSLFCVLSVVCVGGAVWSRSHFSPTQAFYSSSLSNTPSPLGTCFSVIARFDSPPLFFHSTHRYPGCNGERKVSVILNARWCHLFFLSVDSKSSSSILLYCSQEGHDFLWIILSFIFSRLFNSLQLVLFVCLLSSLFIPLSITCFLSVSLSFLFSGETVLHKAASLCQRTICHYLVEAGASLMKTDLQVR